MVESRDDFLLSLKKLLNLDLCEYFYYIRNMSSSTSLLIHVIFTIIVTSCSKEEKSLPFTTYDSLRERLDEVKNVRNTLSDHVEQEWKAQQGFLESW